ncbi:methionine--tRNA ligase [Patescibacteria group bacterium]|nr:methionine--tRNA ligase [Patescibacteria group bacterium]MBU1500650.1 methionine--tRNA ligase [Patescibacteria group bacterium]MBU2080397.1 methionine--tRNA ligase [Patescibacteria group bacterium]MBU2124191.1 methionine--tRNA ligase [Patescibacteria group bacterium]MBU2194358.1 methionine--tRNA ligase [Patescibacteria group bacterium]
MARYVTTTLPYVNADPHIGFALEIIEADVIARAWRLRGEEVFFSTGADEHGQKIWEAAERAGKNAQEYVDYYAHEVEKLKEALSLSTDHFIRTTDTAHKEAAQEMWRRCMEAGDIYKKSYTGRYCVGCEAYKTERELDAEEHCVLHPSLTLEERTEENYFFAFSKYTEQLLAVLNTPASIVPEWRREEAVRFVTEGLEDFSISRKKEKLSWGVPVPGDDTQVMYVWFDALTSYLSTLGWPRDGNGLYEKFWVNGTTLQMAGKDQVRFQSLMWQAMLCSAGIKNTDQVFYHGFINSGGQRMSKSLGNVISPYELVEKYGTEATRYVLLRHVHPTEDSDVTWERLDEWYTANLVNGLGNLLARIMKLAETHLEKGIDQPEEDDFDPKYWNSLDTFEFSQGMDLVWSKIQVLDERITREEPFKLVKSDPEAGRKNITELTHELYAVGRLLAPFMPDTSERIKEAVLSNKKPENLFPRLS